MPYKFINTKEDLDAELKRWVMLAEQSSEVIRILAAQSYGGETMIMMDTPYREFAVQVTFTIHRPDTIVGALKDSIFELGIPIKGLREDADYVLKDQYSDLYSLKGDETDAIVWALRSGLTIARF